MVKMVIKPASPIKILSSIAAPIALFNNCLNFTLPVTGAEGIFNEIASVILIYLLSYSANKLTVSSQEFTGKNSWR